MAENGKKKMGRPDKMNIRAARKIDTVSPCVYRYVDTDDDIVKYIGIVYKDKLEKRLKAHFYNDDWCKFKNRKIEYFECMNRSEAEAFESHLIAFYETWKYYNKAKSSWGINRFLPDVSSWWKSAYISSFLDFDTLKASIIFRKLLREGKADDAKMFMNVFEFN